MEKKRKFHTDTHTHPHTSQRHRGSPGSIMTTNRGEDKCTCIENLLRATYTYVILTTALWNQYVYPFPRSDSCDSEKISKLPKVIKASSGAETKPEPSWVCCWELGTRAADE